MTRAVALRGLCRRQRCVVSIYRLESELDLVTDRLFKFLMFYSRLWESKRHSYQNKTNSSVQYKVVAVSNTRRPHVCSL